MRKTGGCNNPQEKQLLNNVKILSRCNSRWDYDLEVLEMFLGINLLSQ
jgi:hypothetical protein